MSRRIRELYRELGGDPLPGGPPADHHALTVHERRHGVGLASVLLDITPAGITFRGERWTPEGWAQAYSALSSELTELAAAALDRREAPHGE